MSESENKNNDEHHPHSPKTASPSSSASAKSPIGRRRSPPASSRWRCWKRRSSAPKQDSGAQVARRDRLARHRQFPELALSRPGKAALPSASASSRRTPITVRSAARARSAICMKRRSASRAANAASPRSAAPRRSRPRPRPSAPASTLPWTPFAHDVAGAEARRRVPEADGGEARRVQAGHGLSVLRGRHVGALGPDPARGDGGIRRTVVDAIRTSPRKIRMPG